MYLADNNSYSQSNVKIWSLEDDDDDEEDTTVTQNTNTETPNKPEEEEKEEDIKATIAAPEVQLNLVVFVWITRLTSFKCDHSRLVV